MIRLIESRGGIGNLAGRAESGGRTGKRWEIPCAAEVFVWDPGLLALDLTQVRIEGLWQPPRQAGPGWTDYYDRLLSACRSVCDIFVMVCLPAWLAGGKKQQQQKELLTTVPAVQISDIFSFAGWGGGGGWGRAGWGGGSTVQV